VGPGTGIRRPAFLLVSLLVVFPTPWHAAAQDTGESEGDPRSGWVDGSFFLESADGAFRLTFGGRVQPRYQFDQPLEGESTSSFFLRRVRLDVQGHLFDDRLTFRVMPELARTATLRDGWVNYAFGPMLQVRTGQLVVPFHWHRFMSGNRQQFAERSVPSETFGFPNGYDVGVALHGRNPENTLSYGVGLFDGAGRNVRESNSAGNMASGRITWAPVGELPREEPDQRHSEELGVSLGMGLQAASRNEARAWDLGRSTAGNSRADWIAATGDVSVRRRGASAFVEGYLRRVRPDDPDVGTYSGVAHTLGAGYFVVPRRYEIVGRRSELWLDRQAAGTRVRQVGLGVNAYHQGHLWKTHVQFFRTSTPLGDADAFLVQLHLAF